MKRCGPAKETQQQAAVAGCCVRVRRRRRRKLLATSAGPVQARASFAGGVPTHVCLVVTSDGGF